jgi:DNA repair protein RadA/Sms
MAKTKTAYVCSNCGQESTKWIGKCPNCGEWNTFKEIRLGTSQLGSNADGLFRHSNATSGKSTPIKLSDIPTQDDPRIDMHDGELNRVLGGGLVAGSIVLLGGEPGIGKSTLTLQTILNIPDRKILYVSGEESAHQLKMRAERLLGGMSNATTAIVDNINILCETSLQKIFEFADELAPELLVIDSIQTIATDEVESSPGSITQVRECAASLLRFAKTTGTPVILIGHINKEGTLAGPKILEHIVEYTAAPGNETLLHVSELAWERTENVADVVNMGDVFMVKYLGVDPKTRKEKVSRKALMPRPPREEKKE